MTVGVFAFPGLGLWPLLFMFAWLYLFAQGFRRAAAAYAGFYGLLAAGVYLMERYELGGLLASSFYFFLLLRMSPVIMCLHALLLTPPGEIIAVLARLRLPRRAALMVVVVFRYAPTVVSELHSIRQALKSRGLLSFRRCLRHPGRSLEYVLLPLLMRALNVADELSIAALVRGVECPGRKSSYHQTRFLMADCLCLAALAALTAWAGFGSLGHD